MTKKEYYAKMRDLFQKHFGADFKEHKREIQKALREGVAPEINELYQYATYDLKLHGGGYQCGRHFRVYNLWDYDRLNKLWKYL